MVFSLFNFDTVLIVANMNWSGHNFALEQKDIGSASGYPVAADRTVPNGMKDFSRPVCDMLEKNSHLCSVLNAPLPNSAIRVPINRLPLTNCHPLTPSIAERRMTGVSCLPQTSQQHCRTFSNGALTPCGVYNINTLRITVPGNRPAAGSYCDSSISMRGCCPPDNGMLVSYAETRNGYYTNTAVPVPGVMVRQPVSCRSYGPAVHWSVAPAVSSVNSEFVCKVNGTASSAPRTNTTSSNLHFSAVMVSASIDRFVLKSKNFAHAHHSLQCTDPSKVVLYLY